VQIKINLASASLKDAEHAIFIIGAYFGMTNLPNIGRFVHTGAPASVADMVGERPDAATLIRTGADVTIFPDGTAALSTATATLQPPLAPLPTAAGPSAAEVFGGNAPPSPVVPIAAAPVGIPAAPAPAPVASVTPVGVELDNEGLPWDARINALGDGGVHPKNANGNWRAKRGLNDGTLVARVKAELRQTLAAGTPPAAIPPGPVVPAASPTAPPAVVLPPAPPAAPSAPVGPPETFEMLMPRITPVVAAGHLPPTALHAAATAYGLPNALALTQRPDLVPTVWLYLQSICPQLQ
jgi:hypothetical protein